MRALPRVAVAILVSFGLVFSGLQAATADDWETDFAPPEIISLVSQKSFYLPGEVGYFTVRFRDDNPDEASLRLWGLPHFVGDYSYETMKSVHPGAVPGSVVTDADGITSARFAFQVLDSAPYGRYRGGSVLIQDRRGNWVSPALPEITVDDPAHPVDNDPTITGDRHPWAELVGNLEAPGATVTYEWEYRTSGMNSRDVKVGTGVALKVPLEAVNHYLTLRAVATWPDGVQRVRSAGAGPIWEIPIEVATVELAAAPTVGQRAQAVFKPLPGLPFTPTLDSFDWYVDGEFVAHHRFTPTKEHVGKKLHVVAWPRIPSGTGYTDDRERLPTSAAAVIHDGPVSPPEISGAPHVGRTLTASEGTWSRTPEALDYAWLRDGTPIPDARAATYKVTERDYGTMISVRVTARWSDQPAVTSTSELAVIHAIVVTPTAPTFNASANTVVIPATTGAIYYINGTRKSAGIYRYPTTGQVTAQRSGADYYLAGTTSWKFDNRDAVTPAKPEFNGARNTVKIPAKTGVAYYVNGTRKSAGTHRYTSFGTVTAKPASGDYKITGTTSWKFDNRDVVTAPKPEFNGTRNTVKLPAKTGVLYYVNGTRKSAGTHRYTGSVTVTARPYSFDYRLSGQTTWSARL